MLNLNYLSSIFNKFVVTLAVFSLLVTTFCFSIDENIKQEINTIYKATSICEYYNSITNFSYGVINKILKSVNIDAVYTAKTDSTKDKKQNKKNNRFDFVQPTNKNGFENFKSVNLSSNSIILTTDDNFSFYKTENYIFIQNLSILLFIFFSFCYFARGNIEDNIKFYNRIIKDRLV